MAGEAFGLRQLFAGCLGTKLFWDFQQAGSFLLRNVTLICYANKLTGAEPISVMLAL
jgi:hypothetical protein